MPASGFTFSFLFIIIHIQHTYSTKTVILTQLLSVLKYRYTSLHVTWSAQAVCELKIDYNNPSICVAQNLKHIIVKWVGIETHTYNNTLCYSYFNKLLNTRIGSMKISVNWTALPCCDKISSLELCQWLIPNQCVLRPVL